MVIATTGPSPVTGISRGKTRIGVRSAQPLWTSRYASAFDALEAWG